ncbi:MAG: SMI1/KNR4 family protein [Planctomycetaceae bacterium]
MLPAIRRELEEICGAPLPALWLQLIAEYPTELRLARRSDDDSDDEEGCVGDAELLADPADILALNREVRATPVPDAHNREFLWPARYVVIGESGDGDYYCINADDPDCGVYQFLHLQVRFKRLTSGFSEFLEMLVDAYLDFDDDVANSEDMT